MIYERDYEVYLFVFLFYFKAFFQYGKYKGKQVK